VAVQCFICSSFGNDTVIVEDLLQHASQPSFFGKAFPRYPEDQVGVFDFHFYPDGSIKH